jgi:prephenate dehydrogenase
MYNQAPFLLCETESSTNETKNIVSNFVELINSKPIWIDSKKHDELISLTSHLPHILSSALVSTAMQKHEMDELLDLASGGFDGATRLSRTSPNMISDMYLTNDLNVKTLIKELIEELEKIILIEDQELMLNYLSKTVDWRRALADKFGERKLK